MSSIPTVMAPTTAPPTLPSTLCPPTTGVAPPVGLWAGCDVPDAPADVDQAEGPADEEGALSEPSLVELPTNPTPYAFVDAPSRAHIRPPLTWLRNVSSCHAEDSEQWIRGRGSGHAHSSCYVPRRCRKIVRLWARCPSEGGQIAEIRCTTLIDHQQRSRTVFHGLTHQWDVAPLATGSCLLRCRCL
jgi:hypothetical protein